MEKRTKKYWNERERREREREKEEKYKEKNRVRLSTAWLFQYIVSTVH